jgi:hypothetical protein
VAKRLSGGRRRTLRKQGSPRGKLGRPRGQTARNQELLANIHRDLIWLGEPDRPHSKLSRDLLDPKASELDLLQVLLNHEPEYLHIYRMIGGRAFRRHVAAIQKKIWPFARRKPFGH